MENRSLLYKIFACSLTTIAVSLYLFPVVFTFLPIANSKMILAGFGLITLFINMAKGRTGTMKNDLLFSSLAALAVSFAGIVSVIINGTSDYTYASYIVSMWVWMGGAYFCINLIRFFHGKATTLLVANYLIAVCVLQCISAILIGSVSFFNNLATNLISEFAGIDTLQRVKEMDRIYGFGAALDPAGTRFAAILIIIGFILTRTKQLKINKFIPLYIISIMIIILIGCMISRTTFVGGVLALILWFYYRFKSTTDENKKKVRNWAVFLTAITVAISIFKYNNDYKFQKDIRFAFEGFFSLVETGKWQTTSNDRLRNMYIFPDNTKTWLIGDGYFGNPNETDPYYIGNNRTAFYKGTDVGYCRFLFYFGAIGLLAFSAFMITVGYFCGKNNPQCKLLFFAIVLLNFIVWFKVSTDLFLVFAPFLCLTPEENKEDQLDEESENAAEPALTA